jgi:hypothetical protein
MLVNNWDVNKNFWIENPKFLTVKSFLDFYNEDKTSTKAKSSKKMWGTALLVDYDSLYFNMYYDDRVELLTEEYGIPDTQLCEAYNKLQKDAEKRHLDVWNKKLDELSTFLDTTPITIDNAEDITKLMLNLDKLLNLKDSIEKRISKTDSSRNRGGGNASLLESDVL